MNVITPVEPMRGPRRGHALIVFEPDAHASYSLEMVARLAQVSRHRIGLYCRHGFVTPLVDPADGGWWFDATAVRMVKQLEQIREHFGVNLAGAHLLMRLMEEIDELRREVRFLRES